MALFQKVKASLAPSKVVSFIKRSTRSLRESMKTKTRKVAVYGKKKKNDLAADFAKLTLSPPKKDRAPLGPRSANAVNTPGDPPAAVNVAGSKAAAPRQTVKPPAAKAAPLPPLPAIDDEATLQYLKPLTALNVVEDIVVEFQAWANRISLDWTKIGEGAYGDVYRLTIGADKRIVKCIPLRPQRGPGSRSKHTSVKDAADEIGIAGRMQPIEGFVEFCQAQVVSGPCASQCVDAWNQFRAKGGEPETPDPNDESSYLPDQLWVLVQMKDAGMDLDMYCNPNFRKHMNWPEKLNTWQAWDIFWGVVKALARGEEVAKFEHRDLHLGNICIQHLDETTSLGPIPEQFTLLEYGGKRLGRTSIEITIIDYTLSRITMEDGTVRCNQMKDRSIFNQYVPGVDLQYWIYPEMRELVMGRSRDENKWTEFHPETNVLWLWHLLDKLRKNSAPPDYKGYASDCQFEMVGSLRDLHLLLDPARRGIKYRDIRSATDLVLYAREMKWLTYWDLEEFFEDEDHSRTIPGKPGIQRLS